MRVKDISGNKYGKLEALSYKGKNDKGRSLWTFLCHGCGKSVVKLAKDVTRKRGIKSCGNSGCIEKKMRGLAGSKGYHAWKAMLARCENPNHPEYNRYGGRGIFVCERWHDFFMFLDDMGEPEKGMSLDKINNNDGYYKENCRWVDLFTSNQNTRRSKPCVINGVKYNSIRAASKALSIPKSVLYRKYKNDPPVV